MALPPHAARELRSAISLPTSGDSHQATHTTCGSPSYSGVLTMTTHYLLHTTTYYILLLTYCLRLTKLLGCAHSADSHQAEHTACRHYYLLLLLLTPTTTYYLLLVRTTCRLTPPMSLPV